MESISPNRTTQGAGADTDAPAAAVRRQSTPRHQCSLCRRGLVRERRPSRLSTAGPRPTPVRSAVDASPVRASKRIADLRISVVAIFIARYVCPAVIAVALVQRRRNERAARQGSEQLGSSVAQVVVQAKEGAKALRTLTVVLVVLTVLNVGLVAYSVLK
jgi:hypothetical protein